MALGLLTVKVSLPALFNLICQSCSLTYRNHHGISLQEEEYRKRLPIWPIYVETISTPKRSVVNLPKLKLR